MSNKRAKNVRKEIPYGSRKLLRHSYDQVITDAARLASFAASPLLNEMGSLETRQDELAIGDLISFALHLRRLIEVSGAGALVRTSSVEAIRDSNKVMTPVTTIINKIIHNQRLEILRRESDFLMPPKVEDEAIVDWMKAQQISYFPMFTLRADSGGLIGLLFAKFVVAAHLGVTNKIVEYCEDLGFYLEEIDFD